MRRQVGYEESISEKSMNQSSQVSSSLLQLGKDSFPQWKNKSYALEKFIQERACIWWRLKVGKCHSTVEIPAPLLSQSPQFQKSKQIKDQNILQITCRDSGKKKKFLHKTTMGGIYLNEQTQHIGVNAELINFIPKPSSRHISIMIIIELPINLYLFLHS